MNFLAHIYLSGNDEEVILGNYIADSVKGKDYLNYSEGVQKGILMHRSIDHFTDNHPIVKEGLNIIRPILSRYSGVALDIYFDHFLARDWSLYHSEDYRDYTLKIMELIGKHFEELPGHSKLFYEYAKITDRIYSYRNLKGIEEVFHGMHRRVQVENKLNLAQQVFLENYNEMEALFKSYFPLLITHVETLGPNNK